MNFPWPFAPAAGILVAETGKEAKGLDRETRRRLCRVFLVFLGLAAPAGLVVLLKPPCPFSALTGLSCAGCGGQRMLSALLRGDVSLAFRQNPFLFCALPLLGLYLLGEAVRYGKGRPPLCRQLWAVAFLAALALGAVAFTLLRNLPGFEMLEPVA